METVTIPLEDWKTLVKSVTKMEVLLAGSGMGEDGMVVDFKKVKDKVQKIEDRDNQRKGVMYVLGLLWIGFVTIVGWFISK